ncbi:hypothetical protein [Granulicella sibirica]|uniref:Outer membrane protein beta-barrel domain-containing protein n=1 Tax=Granulicella sibirica TaxID=2479048 RepID=A0A4Q0T158_9BACT|nr:hypothetical protein [Granulicella sibirica]RXH56070.1 hypothetical protein GRAN_2927 [Granulicella sibirica]
MPARMYVPFALLLGVASTGIALAQDGPKDFSTSTRDLPSFVAAPVIGGGSSSTGGATPTVSFLGAFSSIGADAHIGLGGIGFDVATPLTRRINIRLGGDFFRYTDTFVEDQANVTASLKLGSGHASVDWFPFNNSFRISPMINFVNNNRVRATVLVPAGTTITLSGSDYVSSATDPLHGSGSVDFRRTSPGLTIGFGNIIAHTPKHLSFPVELGFYYVGQPTLKIAFSGSACDPSVPASIGCESVTDDPDFQQSLNEFRARNNNNLSYASFFPVLTVGVGYRFSLF